MQLILNDFGSFLGKKGERFVVKTSDKKEEFAVALVEQIIIASASSISVSAIKLALKNDVDIVFFSSKGKPIGRIFPCRLGGTTLTRRKQLEAYYSEKGAEIAKKLIKAKILNQAYFLKSLSKSREIDFSSVANYNIDLCKKLDKLVGNIEYIRDDLFGLEGTAAKGYFECLTKILPFEGRDKDSNDTVNLLLNYGYGILYGETEKACILAGLDPYLGFLHTDRYNKPSMVLDLIEGFRPIIVDRAIVTLFVQKQVSEKLFEHNSDEEMVLNKKGREKIVSEVMARLHTKVNFRDKHLSFQDILLLQARSITNYLLDDENCFEPFIYRW
ncbi:MAG: CRISPR-associated endonuclease Cas1 [Candidatus Diapherotrites archaeon]|nr:CRISPR-associated endonuclease Cas1 [Candidatus Diapherotrites archaeon]